MDVSRDLRGLWPRELRTPRLLLRRWIPSDRRPFAAMNADSQVMEHFPAVLTSDESDAIVARVAAHFDEHGFGLWAVEVPGRAPFIGFVGLAVPSFEAHFTPCVEVGWRLAVHSWGHGYATEAAHAALAFGFDSAGLEEIVSMTVPENTRSRRVMERLGMTRDAADDFDHPSQGRHHVLYRLRASEYRLGTSAIPPSRPSPPAS